MADYLNLPLEGLGSVEVECLSTYIARLAHVHGVSPFQFIHHVKGWWARLHPANPSVPEYMITTGVMSVCGSGDDTRKLVDILTEATGVAGLRTGTLLCLSDVISNSGRLALKPKRAWCPACWSEDLRRDGVIYDRLLWRLLETTRCPIHRLSLLTACPGCGRLQRGYERLGNLAQCQVCRSSLIPPSTTWQVDNTPGFGERDLSELVALSSAQSDKTFDGAAYKVFCAAIAYRNTRRAQDWNEVEFKQLIHSLRDRFSPTLRHLLKAAAVMDVPLRLILEDPKSAAAVANVPARQVWKCEIPLHDRPWYSAEKRKATGEALRAALAASEAGRPVNPREIAAQHQVSDAAAKRWYPILFEALESRYMQSKASEKAIHSINVIRAFVDEGLLDAYRSGAIASQDELFRRIAGKTGASIHYARTVYGELIGKDRS